MSVSDPLPKLTLSAAVKQAVGPEATPEARQKAARGELKLSAQDFLAALLVLCSGNDPQLKKMAVQTLRRVSAEKLAKLAAHSELHPRLLDFLVRGRMADVVILEAALANLNLPTGTAVYLSRQQKPEVLKAVVASRWLEDASVRQVLDENPAASALLPAETQVEEELPEEEDAEESEVEGEIEEVEEEKLSKYQMALEMGVSEKIKMALTGDKEWRSLLYKDSNKLVNSAVLKNPRITDGEALAIAKDKAASDEHIRIISLNRKWIKLSEMQKALVVHPRTPLPKALRYMNVLTTKELKSMSKSKTISQVIVNNARRMLVQREKKS